MSQSSTIRWEEDENAIVTLTMDDPSQSANTMNRAFLESFGATTKRLVEEKERIKGVVLASAKKTFFAGGDLRDLLATKKSDAKQSFERGLELKRMLRALETLGKPIVAAINGAALGGGYELTLACHHRIALDVPATQIGLPEVTLGLLPGGGGVQRTVRLMGITDALMKVLLQGQRYGAKEALAAGLIHATVATAGELIPAAKAWIVANPSAVQPWDVKGYKIPGGTPATPAFAMNLPAFPANLRKQLKGANYPAPRAILAAAVEGAQVEFDDAGIIETRWFVDLATGQIAKNMITTFFFGMQQIKAGGSRPKDLPKRPVEKVAIVGAGMMGAGIAYVCAKAGLEVVLHDVSLEAAHRGKQYSATILEKAIERKKSTREKADALLARITPTADLKAFAGCDLVVEAVYESESLKREIFGQVESIVTPDATLGSNTSTLPITKLAEGVKRPEDFIGLHFFSPVDKMPLLEIITGAKTSPATLARAFDFAAQIEKTPILVNDSRGFFTSRVIGKFLSEAMAMVGQGVPPASIEQAGAQAGYPAPPLQLMDELTLTLSRKIRVEAQAAAAAEGRPVPTHPSDSTLDKMVELGRGGRSTGGAFYEYENGKRTRLWPELAKHFPRADTEISFEDMKERMLFSEALETVKCFDEGVLRSVVDANVGSILGIGFPAWTGGVIQYIEGYPGGLKAFVARAEDLARRYGERFQPPASLLAAASGSQPVPWKSA